MVVASSSLWKTHWTLWQRTFSLLWKHRHALALLTVVLWVPWRVLVPIADRWLGFGKRVGFPLEWVADALYEPLYGGAVLALFADSRAMSFATSLAHGAWFMPRIFLIELKIAVWGLAAPYLVLHLGSALMLTWWSDQLGARLVIAMTVASMAWIFVVLLRYFIAPAVLVAERLLSGGPGSANGDSEGGEPLRAMRRVSTGWSLWAARRLVRGRMIQALLVLILGEGAVFVIMAFLPRGEHVVTQIVSGVAMIATTLWWGLLWEFTRWCVAEEGARGS